MNLIIDIGNTRTKLAVFESGMEIFSSAVDELLPLHIKEILEKYQKIDRAILCGVKDYPANIKLYLQKRLKQFIELDENTALPIENHYKTKSTLGKDRLAAAVGAAFLYPKKNILVIDAGTAITYDLINDQNQFLGGNISPGIDLRYKALHYFTGRLPLVEHCEFNGLFGQTTKDAILSGIQNGV